jgi:hypothetical protein
MVLKDRVGVDFVREQMKIMPAAEVEDLDEGIDWLVTS